MTREDTVTLTSKQYHDLVTALEQEKGAYNALAKDCIPMSVIEDIKAEIEDYCKRYNITFDSSISACIDIIDKYTKGDIDETDN